MGASYVEGTGVGPGSAEGKNRGPGNGRNQFFPLLDPHVVAHGTTTTNGDGDAIVPLPSNAFALPTHLTVFVSGKGYAVEKILNSGGLMVAFHIYGLQGMEVDYIVMDANNDCFCENYFPPQT